MTVQRFALLVVMIGGVVWLPLVAIKSGASLRIADLQCETRDEYVMILNAGSFAVNLSGWRIISVNGQQSYSFPEYQLDPGARVSVHSGPDAPATSGSDLFWTSAYIWNNDGDEARLMSPFATIIDARACGQ